MTIKEIDRKTKIEDVAAMNILNDKPAIAKYGDKGKNGVIEIFSKKKGFVIKEMMLGDTLPKSLKAFENYLIIVDGKEKDVKAMESLDPMDIELITVLKDKEATAKYGDKGKNGVIEIYSKKKDVVVEERILQKPG